MGKPTPLFPEPRYADGNQLEEVLLEIPLDYRCHRALYTTIDGERGIGTLDRDVWGNMTVRRVLPGRHEEATGLRNWLEVAIFLDIMILSTEWRRDFDEEEKRRGIDRSQLGR